MAGEVQYCTARGRAGDCGVVVDTATCRRRFLAAAAAATWATATVAAPMLKRQPHQER